MDSVSLDPHKWLFAPLDAGCALVRDATALARAFSYGADYVNVIATPEMSEYAFWNYGPELSRQFRALKIWMLLKCHGTRAIGQAIEKNISLARRLGELVDEAPDFELPDLAGERHKLSEFRGKDLLLIFFNPKCGFCTKMADDLAALPLDGENGRAVPLVVTTGDREDNLQLVGRHGIRGPVLLQKEMQVASQFHAQGTPMGYRIDKEGLIASELTIGAEALSPQQAQACRQQTRADSRQAALQFRVTFFSADQVAHDQRCPFPVQQLCGSLHRAFGVALASQIENLVCSTGFLCHNFPFGNYFLM